MGLFSSPSPPPVPPPPPPLPGATPPVPANAQMMAAFARRSPTDPTILTREPGLLPTNQAKAQTAQAQLGGGGGTYSAQGAAGPGIAGPRAG